MERRVLSEQMLDSYRGKLIEDEKSRHTIEKYIRDIRAFMGFCQGQGITKEVVISYKKSLIQRQYAIGSINSMLISINGILTFLGWQDCRTVCLRTQAKTFQRNDRILTRDEYFRLLKAAGGDPRLCLLLQTICGTGIRVSELQFFTVEAVRGDAVQVNCKNKTRKVILPGALRKALLHYVKENKIVSGPVFRTRSGKPLDRSNIWHMMKALCRVAGVEEGKVFPHNLRKLFARCFYRIEKDISKLADLLGHSSINTTRIYLMTTITEHQRQVDKMRLIL